MGWDGICFRFLFPPFFNFLYSYIILYGICSCFLKLVIYHHINLGIIIINQLSNNSNVDKNTTTTNAVVVASAAVAGQGQDQDQEGSDQKSLLVGHNTTTTTNNKKYNDLLKSYKEFTESMLLPESAVTVQGMKNFIRQFVTAAEQKINDVNDHDVNDNNNNNNNKEDALLRNMATSLNNHVRSSYESLTGTRRNSSGGGSCLLYTSPSPRDSR